MGDVALQPLLKTDMKLNLSYQLLFFAGLAEN
jgi:hypothetical protein